MAKPTIPIVNINGSSKESLLDGLKEVSCKINALRLAMRRIDPHGRDFQLQPAEQYLAARVEWCANLDKLDELDLYYSEMMRHIRDQ